MRLSLLELLTCPSCRSSFTCMVRKETDGEIESGELDCSCGRYPIIDFIPRLLPEHRNAVSRGSSRDLVDCREDKLLRKTRASFGYQWTTFGHMHEVFEKNFLNYVAPIQPSFFPRKLGLDAGCGFGRHMYYAARYGAEMVGLDASEAIVRARQNASGRRTHFVQGDLLHPPFREGVFDFVYCIGVLHHLPDPEAGFQALHRLAKPDAPFWIWVYSKRRRILNFLLESSRAVTTRLPFRLLRVICYLAALVDYGFFVLPSRFLIRTPLERALPPRLRLYADYPFQVCFADWFDRLSAPVRFYYDETDLAEWAERAGWSSYRIEPTGLYGFRLQRDVENAPCVA